MTIETKFKTDQQLPTMTLDQRHIASTNDMLYNNPPFNATVPFIFPILDSCDLGQAAMVVSENARGVD